MQAGQGLDALFQPRSIAIVGASQDATKAGGRPVQLLQTLGFPGRIYPVNPRAAVVQGLPAYASVADLPETPDLVIIALAAEATPDALEACAARGIRGAIVFSSGFSELGHAGEALQARLRATARRTGMRVAGPNCLGVVSVAERCVATFSIVMESGLPPAGTLGIVSQSGNIGSFTMLLASERGLGVSRFLTTGNECDVDVADGIAWMARDPATRVILCCLETCRDAPRLVAALAEARRCGKPVVVLKIGATEAGQAAAASHTGALAGSEAVFDAVFRRAGAIRVRSVEQLVELGHAASLLGDRLPAGRRVALLTASGGFGVLLADAASAAGLSLPEPPEAVQRMILDAVPYASPRNPIDATAHMSSRPEILERIICALLDSRGYDALVLMMASSLYLPRLRTVFMAALAGVRERFPDAVVLLCAHAPRDAIGALNELGYPVIDGVDACCTTLAGLAGMAELRGAETPAVAAPPPPITPPPAPPPPAILPPDALTHELGAKRALAAAGVPVLAEHLVHDAEAAVLAAGAVGYPVVLKIVSPDLPHKTEAGGVLLNLGDAAAVRTAHAAMLDAVRRHAPAARIEGVLVAPMATGGTEMILGVSRDPVFGPVVMAGLGGVFAEIMRDVAVRPAPVDAAEAMAMLRSLLAFPVLDGARGRPRADLPALVAAIVALSRFAVQHAETVAEIDVNPVLVRPEGQGVVALDALLIARHPIEKAA